MTAISPSWQDMYADQKTSWFWPPAYDPQADLPELQFALSQLDAPPGSRILDLACGRGWLTIPMALKGFQVTGLDLSEIMLERAKQGAMQAQVQINWVRGDMRQLPDEWSETFDFVTFTLSEFGCFSDEAENQKVLQEAARVLKKGGRFLIDLVANRDGLISNGATIDVLEGDGFLVEEIDSLDLLSGIHKRVYRWYESGQLYQAQWQIQAYTPPEVKRMVEKAGLQVMSVYGDLTGRELSPDSMFMTFLVQKL